MLYESDIEEAIIGLLEKQNYDYIDENYEWIYNRKLDEFVNVELLKESISKINNITDEEIINDAINTILRLENPSLFERNFN